MRYKLDTRYLITYEYCDDERKIEIQLDESRINHKGNSVQNIDVESSEFLKYSKDVEKQIILKEYENLCIYNPFRIYESNYNDSTVFEQKMQDFDQQQNQDFEQQKEDFEQQQIQAIENIIYVNYQHDIRLISFTIFNHYY